MTKPYLFVAAVALIDSQGCVLLAQRPEGKDMAGLWEFPGGKVEDSETPEAALVREMKEELGLTVNAHDLSPLTFASHKYAQFHLFMPLYACRTWSGLPQAMEGQALAWAHPSAFSAYPMPAADEPLAAFLQRGLYSHSE